MWTLRLLARVRDDQWRLPLMKYANEARAEGVPVRTGEILYEAHAMAQAGDGQDHRHQVRRLGHGKPPAGCRGHGRHRAFEDLGREPGARPWRRQGHQPRLLQRSTLPVEFIDGQRVTTDDAMDLVRMVLTGRSEPAAGGGHERPRQHGRGRLGHRRRHHRGRAGPIRELGRVGKITRINTPAHRGLGGRRLHPHHRLHRHRRGRRLLQRERRRRCRLHRRGYRRSQDHLPHRCGRPLRELPRPRLPHRRACPSARPRPWCAATSWPRA